MGRTRLSAICLAIFAASGIEAATAAGSENLLSVARPSGSPKKTSASPAASTASAKKPADKASPATTAVNKPAEAAPDAASTMPFNPMTAVDGAPAAVPTQSQFLAQAQAQFKANPNTGTFAEFLRVFKGFLAQPGMSKTPAAAIIKANPVLSELGAKVIEAGAGRLWIFPRIPYSREVIAQWFDTKATTTMVGRRHKIKRVTYTSISRLHSLVLPGEVTLKDARVLAGDEGARYLVLVGDEAGSRLWLHAFRTTEGQLVDSPNHFDSIPTFLTNNVSGKVAFRGPDLILTVGRVVPANGSQTTQLPEAESSTYRFWVKLTDSGYVLQRYVPDIAQFSTVRQFLEAIANNRTDVARSLLADSKLLSIPKYVGVRGPSSTFRVVQMASPPSGAPRYRIITSQKNDLIFEIARMKDRPIVRSIFIAPPDTFLQEIAKILPTYDQVIPPTATPTDNTAAEAKHP